MDAPAPAGAPHLAIRFDNLARERVHVYLVGESREWLLGRVDPGVTAWLPLPTRALASAGNVRLAVLEGAPPSLQAARDFRAVTTMNEPAAALLDRRWSFGQGQLKSLQPAATTGGRRPDR